LRPGRAEDAEGPIGVTTTLSVTAPANPFSPDKLIDVVEALCPTSSVKDDDGRAVIVKSTKWNEMEDVV
jgi:hypothetical protein